MSKRRGLGRGLSALIPQSEDLFEGQTEVGLQTVAVEAIRPNPHQPRENVDDASLDGLAASIQEHGLIQPLIVQDDGDGQFTLIAGERRWRAAQRAGLRELPVVIKEATPQAMLELALVENIQRADLNPLEEAAAYQQLIEEFGLTHSEVAERVGKSRPAVSNTVRLLELPSKVQQAVVEEKISGGHARALLGLPTPEAQTAVMSTILNKALSVRQTEALVAKMKEGERSRPRRARRLPPELRALESRLRESLNTRVTVQKGASGGKVIIHYYSDEELQAIYEAIVGE